MSSGIALVVSAGTLVVAIGCNSGEPKMEEPVIARSRPVVTQLAQQAQSQSREAAPQDKPLVGPIVKGFEREHEQAEKLAVAVDQLFTDKSLLETITTEVEREKKRVEEAVAAGLPPSMGMSRLVRMTRHLRHDQRDTAPSIVNLRELWKTLDQEGFDMAIYGFKGKSKNMATGLAYPAYEFNFTYPKHPSVKRELDKNDPPRPVPLPPEVEAKFQRESKLANASRKEEELVLGQFATDEIPNLMSNPTKVAGKAVGKIYMQARAITLSEDMCLSCHTGKKKGDPLAVMVYAIRKKS